MIGSVSKEVLEAMLEAIPVEFSVVDAGDEVLAWNRHETRIFKRPAAAVGRNVRNCHPKKSLDKVETILGEMKAGTRESASFWIDLPLGEGGEKEKVLIQYVALRDTDGRYLAVWSAARTLPGSGPSPGKTASWADR